jgi:hypothetical protein
VHEDNLARRESAPDQSYVEAEGRQAAALPPAAGPSDTSIVPYDELQAQAETLRTKFANARPFPHLVLDDFLTPGAARAALESFPPSGDKWIHYLHYNERTFGMNDRRDLPEAVRAILDELNSDRFVSLLESISGIPSLCADPSLEGGGLHQSERGGYLNLHADFTVHPHRPEWRRRLNLLVFLNPDWDDAWGGHVELWDAGVRSCEQRITPLYNRAVLFRTDEHSFHGYPDPLRCPAQVIRRSLALYYFTEEKRPRAASTEYRGRPGDGVQHVLIFLDKIALRLYDRAKRVLGLDDRFASRLLRALSRGRSRR